MCLFHSREPGPCSYFSGNTVHCISEGRTAGWGEAGREERGGGAAAARGRRGSWRHVSALALFAPLPAQ
ncbi:hypothetical protein E2C01_094315 [Portunus trituberculatus]|uniref:Uncharacterized protein n=1 Tax=Portunus trituberculatus TaxID=210409 RepID=A0A5B7K0G3_PORTR|nr:hypothetical protein [Portunus trituberculatus]